MGGQSRRNWTFQCIPNFAEETEIAVGGIGYVIKNTWNHLYKWKYHFYLFYRREVNFYCPLLSILYSSNLWTTPSHHSPKLNVIIRLPFSPLIFQAPAKASNWSLRVMNTGLKTKQTHDKDSEKPTHNSARALHYHICFPDYLSDWYQGPLCSLLNSPNI